MVVHAFNPNTMETELNEFEVTLVCTVSRGQQGCVETYPKTKKDNPI